VANATASVSFFRLVFYCNQARVLAEHFSVELSLDTNPALRVQEDFSAGTMRLWREAARSNSSIAEITNA
jgi:hypothetical protein